MRFVDTFEKHRRESNKSLEAYIKECRQKLGEEIAQRHKIYLDTKYWIMLRDYKLGRAVNPAIPELSSILRDGVSSNKLICPISADIFLEIAKQSNPITLKCSFELIDELSKGISILDPVERAKMELLQFIRTNSLGEGHCYSQEIFIWTKLAYVLGTMLPYNTIFTPEEELVIQKSFFDQMWSISLNDMIEIMGMDTFCKIPNMPDISGKLNKGKIEHLSENKSFEGVFLSEVAGILDTYIDEFSEMFVYLYKKLTGISPSENEVLLSDGPQKLANLIYHGFRLKRFSTEFPSINIPATIHAAIRWDRGRKYKPTDFYDFRHAETALPYFDVFLTENSLCHLLMRSDLSLDRLYNCEVISDPAKTFKKINDLISQP
jgi:hypothetical protein